MENPPGYQTISNQGAITKRGGGGVKYNVGGNYKVKCRSNATVYKNQGMFL